MGEIRGWCVARFGGDVNLAMTSSKGRRPEDGRFGGVLSDGVAD